MRRLLVALLLGGLAAQPVAAREAPTLRIAAASDLRYALPKLLAAFDEGRRASLSTTFGSSGKLHTQIGQGAPYDLYCTADARLIDALVASGRARAETRTVLGEGRLVLWSRPGARVDPARGLAGLAAVPGLRLAIANPDHAPYGRAAREALQHAGAWGQPRARIVQAENVAQAAQFAASGAASAALIARPLLQEPALAAGRYWQVPATWHGPLVQEAVVLTRCREPLALRLIAFFACARGQAILQEAGLAPVTARPGRGTIPGGIR